MTKKKRMPALKWEFEMKEEEEEKKTNGGGPTINSDGQAMTINNKSMALKMLFIRKCRYKNLIDKLNCLDCFFFYLSLSLPLCFDSDVWPVVICHHLSN